MTQVDFHSGVADKLGHACRLVRKAWRSGHRVVVTGAPEALTRLDLQLWTFDPGEFIPHVRLRAGEVVAPRLARTPVWLADVPTEPPTHVPSDTPAGPVASAVLINLGPGLPVGFEQFTRVIEIVALAADEVDSGRQRWRLYLAAGLAPRNHAQAAA